MKSFHKIPFLLRQIVIIIVLFALGKVVFALYNSEIEAFSITDIMAVMWHGALLDFNTTAWILLPALFVTTIAYFKPNLPLRSILTPYYIIICVLVSVTIVADCVMYEFWKFKLSAVVLSYAASPEGASSSVSPMFIISRLGTGIATITLMVMLCIKTTPKKPALSLRQLILTWAVFLPLLVPTSIKTAYFSQSLTKNHAAVNPVRNFISSINTGPYDSWYTYTAPKECEKIVRELYPADTEDITDTLLTTNRPKILFILWESLGSQFVKETGGLDNVTPHISKMIPEGVFWSNYYSNSFRTDRGTVSAFSGYLSYPYVGLMREEKFHPHITSLAQTLNQNGYHTSYLYPGAMTNMGKGKYLADMGFQELLNDGYFTAEELDSPWGASDEQSARKTLGWAKEHSADEEPWFMVYQTVSSHEPFDVPYSRLEEKVPNAFAYTDECVGGLIDSLKALPLWDELLVILIPDHGFLYKQTLQDANFFHSPMIWTGGAIREPRTMEILMNQSDIAATLLSQLSISHKEYKWSRNVLSANYKYPFVYSNYPAGFLFADQSGRTIYDLTADCITTDEGKKGEERVKKGKAILQASHIALEDLLQE